MSVIVKGMEMPECCYDCPFIRASFGYDYYCAKGRGYEDDLKKLYSQRMADCPLVEVNETLFSAYNARRFLMENPPKEGSET